MENKKIVVVGCSSTIGQQICRELATRSERVDLVAGFDTTFSTALNYPFKTYATVDELKVSFIIKIPEEITTVLIDMIISAKEVPNEVYSFASEYNIPIVTIKDANEITETLEKYF